MLNIAIDPFLAKLIEGNEELKKSYEQWLLQEVKLRELSAKGNYTNLKMMQMKGKEKKEKKVFKQEPF